ncbi:proteasome assembly chaperone 2 [Cylas formicarius]|uniref:proteasome assembly chaperone 2 n=1 Tax=Cylas formicarius TaxID=197179 RepID=UPI002958457A|nr:proteasome assembly chaperone 2 [Cylas formicarius]
MTLIKFKSPVDLSDYALIIPTVSIGNVPQLMVDLLITTYNFYKIGHLWHSALVPLVGADPYYADNNEICTACELYYSPELKWATIQLRSTLESKMTLKFLNDLCDEIVKINFSKVAILSSGFDYELKINQEKFFIKSNSDIFKIHNIQKEGHVPANGCGFSFKMFNLLSEKTKCLLLIKFVSEGDNRPDAVAMLEKVLKVFDFSENKRGLVEPSSWKFGFGGYAPLGIF